MKKTNNNIAIQLTNVTKEYTIHHEKPTLVEKFYKGKTEKFIALNDINLTIKRGERIGLIGPNGSGKTTLLKIISKITYPTTGTISIHGKLVSLIDLEAGFHPDLSGVQNIYLNALLLGLNKTTVNKLIEKIISYADIKQFIDAPLYTYSQGMKLRLGFSILIHMNPDILVLDEGLGVGDSIFSSKALLSIKNLIKQNKTIIITSHWLEFIHKNTDKIFILNKGVIQKTFISNNTSFDTINSYMQNI